MLKSTIAAGIGACALAFTAGLANAATVSKQNGSVLVSTGEGFVPIAGDAQLPPGGHVMVRPGGAATIAYGSNCVVRVGSGVWLVQQAAPCPPGTTEIDFTSRMRQQPPPEDPPPETPPPDTPGGIDPTTGLVIGGVAVAGGVGLAVILNNRSNDKPASP